jgi:hypothetical protein
VAQVTNPPPESAQPEDETEHALATPKGRSTPHRVVPSSRSALNVAIEDLPISGAGDQQLSANIEKVKTEESETELRHERKWIHMLGPEVGLDGHSPHTFSRFRRRHPDRLIGRVIKGIPDSCRSRAWLLLLDPRSESHPIRKSPQYYYKKNPEPAQWFRTIQVDVPRTMKSWSIADRPQFEESLKRILVAYANEHPDLGYLQGWASVAGLLLSYMSEMRAFWAFWHLLDSRPHSHRELFNDQFAGFHRFVTLWEMALKVRLPAVAARLNKDRIPSRDYVGNWFHGLFLLMTFPQPVLLRFFDQFAGIGRRALISFGLTLVSLAAKDLLNASKDDIITILQKLDAQRWSTDTKRILKEWEKFFVSTAEYAAWFHATKPALGEDPLGPE